MQILLGLGKSHVVDPFFVWLPEVERNFLDGRANNEQFGADLIGYFAPHEGSATTAYGVYNIASLADYETYRARLSADPDGQANYEFARAKKFIHREERIFLQLASAPHSELTQP